MKDGFVTFMLTSYTGVSSSCVSFLKYQELCTIITTILNVLIGLYFISYIIGGLMSNYFKTKIKENLDEEKLINMGKDEINEYVNDNKYTKYNKNIENFLYIIILIIMATATYILVNIFIGEKTESSASNTNQIMTMAITYFVSIFVFFDK